MALNLTEVSDLIREDLAAGRGTRTTISNSGAVFGVQEGMPPTIADFATQVECDGMTFPVATIAPSATKVAKVAEGGVKPTAITLTHSTVTLEKWSGLAELTLENQLSSAGIHTAIYTALAGQAYLSYEGYAYAAVAAAAADTTATTFLGGIAAAQATLLSKGSRPGVVIVPFGVYDELVGEVVAGPGFGNDPRSAIGTVFGSLVHVSSATGTEVVVADPEALLAVRHVSSPLVVSDPWSKADTNETRLILDVVGQFVVSNTAGVAGFTVGP